MLHSLSSNTYTTVNKMQTKQNSHFDCDSDAFPPPDSSPAFFPDFPSLPAASAVPGSQLGAFSCCCCCCCCSCCCVQTHLLPTLELGRDLVQSGLVQTGLVFGVLLLESFLPASVKGVASLEETSSVSSWDVTPSRFCCTANLRMFMQAVIR